MRIEHWGPQADMLAEPAYRQRAEAIAGELCAEPPVDEAVPLLERLGRR